MNPARIPLARKLLTRTTLIGVIIFASIGTLAAFLYGMLAQMVLTIGVTDIDVSVAGPPEG